MVSVNCLPAFPTHARVYVC